MTQTATSTHNKIKPAAAAMSIVNKAKILRDNAGAVYIQHQVDDGGTRFSPLYDGQFEDWLHLTYLNNTGDFLPMSLVKSIFHVIAARSTTAPCVGDVFLRHGFVNGKQYLDLANEASEIIELDEHGWRMAAGFPVAFRRTPTQRAMATPARDGDATRLFDFLNVDSAEDRMLILATACVMLCPQLERPVLSLIGAAGSAKTSAARFLRTIIDPTDPIYNDYRPDRRELSLVFHLNALPVLDNLSPIPPFVSDMLCKAVTGGGFQARAHYTNASVVAYSYRRGMILTSIQIPTAAPDFLSRAVVIEMNRLTEADQCRGLGLTDRFEDALPGILGGILDVVVEAKKILPQLKPVALPRLMDFGHFGAAVAEIVGFGAAQFLEAVRENGRRYRKRGSGSAAPSGHEPLLTAILKLVGGGGGFDGITSELLDAIQPYAPTSLGNGQRWPDSAEKLGVAIGKIRADLADNGFEIIKKASRWGTRIVIHAQEPTVACIVEEPASPFAGEGAGPVNSVPEADCGPNCQDDHDSWITEIPVQVVPETVEASLLVGDQSLPNAPDQEDAAPATETPCQSQSCLQCSNCMRVHGEEFFCGIGMPGDIRNDVEAAIVCPSFLSSSQSAFIEDWDEGAYISAF